MSPVPALATALAAALVTVGVTPVVLRWARLRGIVDDPRTKPERSVHARPTPLLGGLAVALGVGLALLGAVLIGRGHAFPNIPPARAFGVLLGAVILLIGGYLDDRRNLPARTQFLFPLAAALAAVLGGVAVEFITNPLGGVLRFDALRLPLPWLPDGLPVLGAVLTVLWLLATTFSAKLLDGLDGLVSGVGAISGATLTALALKQGGYDWGMLAYTVGFGGSMIWFGSSAGVALSNMYPEAKSVANWVKHGWHVTLGYVVGFVVLMLTLGWQPTPERSDFPAAGKPVAAVPQ